MGKKTIKQLYDESYNKKEYKSNKSFQMSAKRPTIFTEIFHEIKERVSQAS